MTLELLVAATERHGPPHGLVLVVLAVAVVGWLIYRAVMRRTRSTHETHADGGVARTPSAADDAPDSDRGHGL